MERDEKGRFISKKKERGEEKVYMVGFKGFSPGLICRGKQYAENTIFEEKEAVICRCGMHFCKNPLEVFNYYPPSGSNGMNEFASVEALAPCQPDGGEKFCTKKLRVGAKLSIAGIVKAAIDFTMSNAKKEDAASTSGDYSVASTSGDYSVASTSGDYSVASTSGYRSVASTSGYRSVASTSGNYSVASTSGKESFAISTGFDGKVKGALGCFIACAEWMCDGSGEAHPIRFVSAKVDGKKIKADIWYTVKNGKFIEVK